MTADPTAAEYFDSLPNGWGSFETCVIRTELLGALRERGVITKDTLPARLHRMVEDAETDWMPEIVHVAAMLAVRDSRFGHGPGSDLAFLSWMTQLNRDLFTSSRFAGALSFATPAELITRLPTIWSTFRRGTTVTIHDQARSRVTCVLSHPPALFGPLSLESHKRSVAILLVKAGAVQPNVVTHTKIEESLAHTHLTITWT